MTSSTQWSLFTAFVYLTICAVFFAMVNWFGFEVMVSVMAAFGALAAVAVVCQILFTSIRGLRPAVQLNQEEDRFAPNGEADRVPDVEVVVAAADNGLVNEPNSSIRYLDPPVDDRDVVKLADCAELKWLVLDNTEVSDAGLAFIHRFTKLRRLYVRGSRVTAVGVERLQLALPNVTVLY